MEKSLQVLKAERDVVFMGWKVACRIKSDFERDSKKSMEKIRVHLQREITKKEEELKEANKKVKQYES